ACPGMHESRARPDSTGSGRAPGGRRSACIRKIHPSLEKLSFEPGRGEAHMITGINPAGMVMSDRYPGEIAIRRGVFRLPGGEAVTSRPIRPRDADRLQEHLRGLSDRSRRNRFLGAVNELPPREIARFAHMDQPSALALVACAADGRDDAIIAE